MVRENLGRNATPSMLNSQSVKNCAEKKGYDAGVSGIKRAVQGFPHAITTANVTDRKGAFERCKLPCVEKVLVGGGEPLLLKK